MLDRRLSIAPMMDLTDRHDRYFLRLVSQRVLLYTEMITAQALYYGKRTQLLEFHDTEHPLAVQLGGSDPALLAHGARLAEEFGYDEVNLNVGCPSDRVQSGRFGACLMAEPNLVADCVRAMREVTELPVTVKTRIGIDERDSYPELMDFIGTVAEAGCDTFVIHARKAWLKGLSPKENREIPPLRYEVVYQLKADFPDLHLSLNGGVTTLDQASEHLRHVDGVMIGREAYYNPYLLADADRRIFGGDAPAPSRADIVRRFLPYVETELTRGTRLNSMTRHILGLYQGRPGARAFRRYLSEEGHRRGAGIEVIEKALALVEREAETV